MNNTQKLLGGLLAGLMLLSIIPSATAAYAQPGTIVASGDVDTVYAFFVGGSPHTSVCWIDNDGDAVLDTDEPVYLQVLPCGVNSIIAGDVRLTTSGTYAGGSLVKGSDTDFSRTTAGPVVGAGYAIFDADGDGKYGLNDQVYLDVNGNNVVNVGEIRISNNVAGKPAFSRVTAADNGAGLNNALLSPTSVPVVALPAIGAEAFFDANGNALYGIEDTVYMDMDGSGGPTVNDIRLSMLTSSLGAGSIVGPADVDTVFAYLVPLPAFAAYCFVDTNGDGVLNQDESVYLSRTGGCGAASIKAGDVRLTASGTFMGGTIVKGGDADFNRNTAVVPGAPVLAFFDQNGNGKYDLNDQVYFDTNTIGIVDVSDIRLSNNIQGKTAYSRVRAGDGDVNNALLATIAGGPASFLYYDADGDLAYSIRDVVYLPLAIAGPLSPIVNDLRVTQLSSSAMAGSVVKGGDVDATYSYLVGFPFAAACFVDNDGDLAVDIDEPVYLVKAACGAGGGLVAGDARLSATGGKAGGTIVNGADTDFSQITAAPAVAVSYGFYDADGDAKYSVGDRVYMHFGTAPACPGIAASKVGVADIRLTNNINGKPAFSRVLGGDADLNNQLVAFGLPCSALAVGVGSERFFDADGDGVYSILDQIYLDPDGGAVPAPTINDVRLAGGAASFTQTNNPSPTTTTTTSGTTSTTPPTTTTTPPTTTTTPPTTTSKAPTTTAPSTSPSTSKTTGTPGFELVFLVAALGAAVILVRRKL